MAITARCQPGRRAVGKKTKALCRKAVLKTMFTYLINRELKNAGLVLAVLVNRDAVDLSNENYLHARNEM